MGIIVGTCVPEEPQPEDSFLHIRRVLYGTTFFFISYTLFFYTAMKLTLYKANAEPLHKLQYFRPAIHERLSSLEYSIYIYFLVSPLS